MGIEHQRLTVYDREYCHRNIGAGVLRRIWISSPPRVGDVVVSLVKEKLKLTRYTKEHLKAAAILSVDYQASIRIAGVVVGLIRRFV